MRRLAAVTVCLALLPVSASTAGTRRSWAQPQIRLVTRLGLLPGTPATFDASAPISTGTLSSLVAGLTGKPAAGPADAGTPVTISQLDAALVGALGLRNAAREFTAGARAAGLRPPGRFGTEVVARLIGLRADHPASADALELEPQRAATGAETAFSAARIVQLGLPDSTGTGSGLPPAADAAGAVQYVNGLAATFTLSPLTPLQQEIFQTAISLIGYPYVWGGDDETVTHGFDCSGFIWRVYKLTTYPDAPQLGSAVQGRSAAELAGGFPRRQRITLANLEPADVLFFGNGPSSKPADVTHAAIYLGGGWLIQASNQGVSLAPLADWYRTTFAWGWRPLATPPAVPPPAAKQV